MWMPPIQQKVSDNIFTMQVGARLEQCPLYKGSMRDPKTKDALEYCLFFLLFGSGKKNYFDQSCLTQDSTRTNSTSSEQYNTHWGGVGNSRRIWFRAGSVKLRYSNSSLSHTHWTTKTAKYNAREREQKLGFILLKRAKKEYLRWCVS